MKTYTREELQNILETIVESDTEGWHVNFPKGRKDFLSGIADGGGIFHYYEGREDGLKAASYQSGYVHFYNGKIGVLEDSPLWKKEYSWRGRWYSKDYEIGEHNYSIVLEGE